LRPKLTHKILFQAVEDNVIKDNVIKDNVIKDIDLDDLPYCAVIVKNKGFFVWAKTWTECINR
jgi:hypothetical protein